MKLARASFVGIVAAAVVVACANLDGLAGGAPVAGSGSGDTGTPGETGTGSDANSAAEAGHEVLTFNPPELAFTFDCTKSTSAQTSTVVLTNDNDQGTNFQVSLDQSGPFALRETLDAGAEGGVISGRIEAHATRSIDVVAQPTSTAQSGALHVVADGVDDVVRLGSIADGPRIAFQPTVVDFGYVRQNTSPIPIAVVATNTGSKSVQLIGFTGLPPDFNLSGGIDILPNGTATLNASFIPGPAGSPLKGIATPKFGTEVCGQTPAVTMQGQRVAYDIIVGPGTVELGEYPCNSTLGTSVTVVISNYSGTEVSFTSSLPPTSHFALDPASGKIPPANGGGMPGTTKVTVSAKPPGPVLGDFSENITFAFSTAAGAPTPATSTISVHGRSVGAKLAFADSTLSFGRNTTKVESLTNSGNKTICVTYALAAPEPTFTVESDDTLPVGTSSTSVTFNAPDGARHDAVVKITPVACPGTSAPTQLCAPAPTLAVTGRK